MSLIICDIDASTLLSIDYSRHKIELLGITVLDWYFPRVLYYMMLKAYKWISTGNAGESADSFCERCLREAGVLLLPGSQFDHEPSDEFSNSFRIGFGRHNLPQCMKQLESWLDG